MGAPVQRRDRTLTPYEVAFVAKARSQGRPVSWTNISIQLNRSEHDIRVCCDPTYMREPKAVEPVIHTFTAPKSAVDKIIHEVAKAHGITAEDIISTQLARRVSHARDEAVWKARQIINCDGKPPSFPQLAKHFYRDHSSLVDCAKRHEKRLRASADQEAA